MGPFRRAHHDAAAVRPEALRFPPGFRFGAATAAHQVEGGTTNNNWTRWEQVTRPDGRPGIFTGDRCGAAADHWARFEEDLARMQALGLQLYRFSIEWSRLEPEEGRFDEAALDRYRDWCLRLRAAGIEPMVTLHHFTEPLWITDRGGFEDRRTVDAFARFVAHVVPRLADVVDLWVTVNEPMVYALLGWGRGTFPPGRQEPAAVGPVLENLLLAHAEAYRLLHRLDTVDADGDGTACRAGLAKNVVLFAPRRWWHPADRLVAYLLDRLYNHAVLQALQTGRLRLWLPGQVDFDVTHPALAATWDYAGLNHYFRNLVAFDPAAPEGVSVGFDPACEKNDMGWDLTPHTLYDALRLVDGYGKPIYITENGTCDADVPDRRRQRHLLGSLHAVDRALRDGCDVRAYLYWSLMDNFEWAHGFAPRFGLYRVDYATQARALTGGGALYRDILARQPGA